MTWGKHKRSTTTTMLERVLSLRRAAQHSEEGDDDDDESKTRKHVSFTVRATNHLARTGYLWPCLALCLLLLLIPSLILHSRNFVCVSSSYSDPLSRIGFLNFDGLESDFGYLGVPWCKFPVSLFLFLCCLY